MTDLWWSIFLHQVLWLTPIVGIPLAFLTRPFTISVAKLTAIFDLDLRPRVSSLRMTWHPRYWLLWTERQFIEEIKRQAQLPEPSSTSAAPTSTEAK